MTLWIILGYAMSVIMAMGTIAEIDEHYTNHFDAWLAFWLSVFWPAVVVVVGCFTLGAKIGEKIIEFGG